MKILKICKSKVKELEKELAELKKEEKFCVDCKYYFNSRPLTMDSINDIKPCCKLYPKKQNIQPSDPDCGKWAKKEKK
jgi:hypothetical protein